MTILLPVYIFEYYVKFYIKLMRIINNNIFGFKLF